MPGATPMKKSKSVGSRRKPSEELARAGDANLSQLREDFLYTLNERDSSVFTRARLNYETTNCIWPGQTPDGRKWYKRAGEDQVFPWNGASDAKVPLVGKYIRKHVALLQNLDKKMPVRVNATEVNDEAWANRMTNFLRWMKTTQMTERRRENELLANYLLERGAAVMSTLWCQKTQLQYEVADRETVAQLILQKLQEGDERFADLPGMILDPSFAAEAATLLGELELFGGLPSGRLEKVAQDLALTGEARFPRPALRLNRPKVIARCPNEDIFISPDASNLEDASLYEVEVMREAKFRAMAREYQWNEAWTQEVLEKQQGNVEFGNIQFQINRSRFASTMLSSYRNAGSDTRKLYLVVHAYRRLADADGVPGIFYTVFHPNVDRIAPARHELLNYDHGELPHTLFLHEYRSRRIDDSRGYGEIASTWQNQIKNQWDGRQDRSSIATLPPSYHPQGLAPDKWGPGVQVPTRKPDDYGFMDVPDYDPGSKEMENTVQEFSDDYFGFGNDPDALFWRLQLLQKLMDDWTDGHTRVDTQIVQLCQQFMPDSFYFRVVGSTQAKPIRSSREEIQGQFDISAGYAAENLDPELKKLKLQLMQLGYSLDANGVIDRTEGLKVAFEIIDPNLGERLIKPAEHASLAEVEDEKAIFAQLMAGLRVHVKPGQAYELRLQTLGQLFQENEMAQELYHEREQTKKAFDQRLKDLQQAHMNAPGGPNAVTGRGGPAFKPKMLSDA